MTVIDDQYSQRAKSRKNLEPLNSVLRIFTVNTFSLTIFYIGLSVCYWHLSHFYGSTFFKLDPHVMKILVSAGILILLVPFIEHAFTVKNFFIFLYIYSLMVPGLVWFAIGTGSIFQILIMVGILAFLKLLLTIRLKRPVLRPVSHYSFILAAVSAAGLISLWALTANGGSLNFNIFDVYLYRRETADSLPGVFGYLFPQVSKAMLPLAIALALYHRWWGSIGLICALSVLMFATLHHKAILFSPFLLIVFYYVQGSRSGLRPIILAFGVLGALAAGEALIYEFFDVSNNAGFINLLFIRRIFFVPVILDSFYLEFFAKNPFYFWASSKVTFGLVDTEYQVVSTHLIGQVFFGRDGMSANSGLVASGFANAGLVGVAIYAAILALCLMLLDAHGRRIGHKVVITASVALVHTMMTGSDMLTSLLTGGMGSLLLLLSFLKERE